MKRFTIALTTAAALTAAAPIAYAATFAFDDVTTMQAANGSEVYTSDGKLFGVLTDIDLGANEATFIVEVAASSNVGADTVHVITEEGKVLFEDGRLILQASETELDVGIDGDGSGDDTARFILVD